MAASGQSLPELYLGASLTIRSVPSARAGRASAPGQTSPTSGSPVRARGASPGPRSPPPTRPASLRPGRGPSWHRSRKNVAPAQLPVRLPCLAFIYTVSGQYAFREPLRYLGRSNFLVSARPSQLWTCVHHGLARCSLTPKQFVWPYAESDHGGSSEHTCNTFWWAAVLMRPLASEAYSCFPLPALPFPFFLALLLFLPRSLLSCTFHFQPTASADRTLRASPAPVGPPCKSTTFTIEALFVAVPREV